MPTDTEHDSLRQQLTDVQQKLASFRDSVRDEVLQQHDNGIWCYDGTQSVLEDLDLDPMTFTYTGQVEVKVDVTVHNARDADEACTWVRRALHAGSTDDDVFVNDSSVDDVDLDRD
jgi:L-lactate utilization protein LutB